MINVTDKAAAALVQNLETSKTEEAQVLRLIRMGEGLAFTLDKERQGDQVVEHDKRTVLVIHQRVSQGLEDATLDAVDSPEGTQFVLQTSEQP